MIRIKFSHRYTKQPRDFQLSRLIDVLPIDLKDISQDFRAYDTAFLDGGEGKNYPLPENGDYMVLLLVTQSGHLWTTIRSQRGSAGLDKLSYYKSHIGEWVECEVNEV